MKAQRNVLVSLIMVLAFAFTASGAPISETGKMIVHLKKSGTDAIVVRVANLLKLQTRISIADLNGKIWFSEYVRNETGYAKKFSLKGMPAGEYLLFIRNKKEKFMQAFSKNDYDLVFFETPAKVGNRDAPAVLTSNPNPHKSNIITRFSIPDQQSVGIQLANLNAQKILVQLNKVNSVRILKELVSGQNGYARKFNMEGMESGDYFFVIRTGRMLQFQFFRIEKDRVRLEGRQILESGMVNGDLTVK